MQGKSSRSNWKDWVLIPILVVGVLAATVASKGSFSDSARVASAGTRNLRESCTESCNPHLGCSQNLLLEKMAWEVFSSVVFHGQNIPSDVFGACVWFTQQAFSICM